MDGTVMTWNRVFYRDLKELKARGIRPFKIKNPETGKGAFIALVKTENKKSQWKGCGGIENSWKGINFTEPPYSDRIHFGIDKAWDEPIVASEIPMVYNTSLEIRDIWLYWLGAANRSLGLELPPRIDLTGKGHTLSNQKEQLFLPDLELPVPLT